MFFECEDATFRTFPPSLFYNAEVKTWDVIIIGGGIIGLSLALALRRRGATVLVVERGEPGREASHAAGGMLVDSGLETSAALQPLAAASARMYPEFAKDLELDSGVHVDLRDNGTFMFPSSEHAHEASGAFELTSLSPASLAELEPALADTKQSGLLCQRTQRRSPSAHRRRMESRQASRH